MSVVGRLWRRAPAWRFCLVAAIVCTGLAAMFPPGLPHLPARWPFKGAGAGAARYHAHAVATSSDGVEQIQTVQEGPPLQGSVHFAGRLLPLPVGLWHELALVKIGVADVPQSEILYRVDNPTAANPTLTGLILVTAPGPLSRAVGSVELPPPCATIGRNPGQIVPTLPSQSPLTHECWVLAPVDTVHLRRNTQDDGLLLLALSRLAARHIAVPPQMLVLDYERSDDTGWMNTIIMLPGGHGLRPAETWAARFARPMHRGYDRILVPADLTPAAVDDPR